MDCPKWRAAGRTMHAAVEKLATAERVDFIRLDLRFSSSTTACVAGISVPMYRIWLRQFRAQRSRSEILFHA